MQITINLKPEFEHMTPLHIGEAVKDALAFGTDDPVSMYTGTDALSAPLQAEGDTIGSIDIDAAAPSPETRFLIFMTIDGKVQHGSISFVHSQQEGMDICTEFNTALGADSSHHWNLRGIHEVW